ncbi:hypothetical protein GF385_03600 [Candidatus Dependentiae bacterium]|nr:hypothetical protein [Candidatus Dependentiae bacterium]
MKKLLKNLVFVFVLTNIFVANTIKPMGWLSDKIGFGKSEEERKSRKRESCERKIEETKKHVFEINDEIQKIVTEELKLAKSENKEILGEIVTTIQTKFDFIITNILQKITEKTKNSLVLEYKITNHLAKILNDLWNKVRSTDLAKLLLTKIELLESINKEEKKEEEKESFFEQNSSIKEISELVSKSFSEIIILIKENLEKINSEDTELIEITIENIVDNLIKKINELSLEIIEKVVSVKLEKLFNYLLKDSNIMIRTGAVPVLKYKTTNTIKEYLKTGIEAAEKNKALIIEYTTPHIKEICIAKEIEKPRLKKIRRKETPYKK